ncbi:MAG TPA: hypothetical protein VFH51_16120 [Myxococcota bacterium]|nr:hypothetical protein [Myxococcota bacterium]
MLASRSVLLLALLSCSRATPPPARSDETPERQFILEGLRLEERRDGRVLWTGTGRRGDGDLSVSDVTDLVLVRKPQNPNEMEITLRAPRGHLAFDAGQATFDAVRVAEPGGSLLTATRAHYDEGQGTLVGTGPIRYTTASMRLDATGAIVSLRDGTVSVEGPVSGRLEKARP